MSDLFRAEALAHQQQRLLGSIILRQAWSTQVIVLCFGALVGALLVVVCVFGFARRETLSGRWLPEGGLIHATSTQPGLVEQVRAKEGQAVRKGDLLFVLAIDRAGSRGSTPERVGAALSEQNELLGDEIRRAQQQAAMNRAALENKLGQARAQLRQLRAGMALQQERAELAASNHKRFASAEYATVVSHEKLDDKRTDAIEQAVRLRAMQRDEAIAVAERDGLRAELQAMPVRTQREVAGIRGSLNTVRLAEAENDTRREWEVRAPRAGRVTVVNAEPGQTVAAGDALAGIAPENAVLEAVLYAPSRAAGQIKAGMPAQLRFDALPHQKYGQFAGEVREVSRSPVAAAELAATGTAGSAAVPLYRVRVRLNPSAIPPRLAELLKAGMQLEGTVTLEDRRFYEWMLEPLLGAKGREQ